MRNFPAANQLGITLIELIFTLAIVAVLASLSAPALGNLIQRSHSRSAHAMLVGSLGLARMSSVSTHRETIVCPSSDHAHCSDGIWWQRGWIVFEDANQNNRRDEDEPLLEVVDAQPGVAIVAGAHTTRTDAAGYFVLDLPPGHHSVLVGGVAFEEDLVAGKRAISHYRVPTRATDATEVSNPDVRDVLVV